MDAQMINSLYDQINNYILQHFIFFWAAVTTVLIAISGALYFLVKSIISTKLEKELDRIQSRIKETEDMQRNLSGRMETFAKSQTERGEWTPFVDKTNIETRSKGEYARSIDFCLIFGSIDFLSGAPVENDLLVVSRLPFFALLKYDIIIGNALLLTPNGRCRSFDIIAGPTTLMFSSDSGYLKLSSIEQGSCLTFRALYALNA